LTTDPCLTYARAPDSILYLATISGESWRDINPLTHVQNVPINESTATRTGIKAMNNEIEIGNLVTVVGGDFDGLTGIFDNEFMENGALVYCVVFNENDESDFAYVNAIKKFN
jgi:hypothetical protein